MTTVSAPTRAGGHARSAPISVSIFLGSAALSVLAGGLVAAVTGPLELTQGSWLAAYLVLVCGVGGSGIGTMQAHVPSRLTRPWAGAQLGAWVAGNVAVIVGSLAAFPLGVDGGVVLLEGALLIALIAAPNAAVVGSLKSWGYRSLLVVLILSAPVGSILSHLRH